MYFRIILILGTVILSHRLLADKIDTLPITMAFQLRMEIGNGHFGNAFSFGIAVGVNKIFKITPSTSFQANFQTIMHMYYKGIGAPFFESFLQDSIYLQEGSKPQFKKVQVDWINSLSATYGLNGSNDYRKIIRPIYPMAATIPTAIQNNYYTMINLGTNFIINNNGRSQQTGFAGVGYDRVYLSYYNDGTPFQWLLLGDSKDRWWTGGGYVMLGSENIGHSSWPDRVGNIYYAGFDKFTGYSLKSFEIANKLFLKYVPYAAGHEKVLNQSRIYVMFKSRNQYSAFWSLNDFPATDFQNTIHDKGNMAKHLGYYRPTMSIGGIGTYISKFKIP